MKIRNLLICFLVIGFMASIVAAPALAAKLAPGKLGFFGKGKMARAQTANFDFIRRPDGTQSQPNDPVIWVYPSNMIPDDAAVVSQDMVDMQWAFDNIRVSGEVVLKAMMRNTSTFKEFYLPKTYQPIWYLLPLLIWKDMTLSGEILDGYFQGTGTDLDGTHLMTTLRDGDGIGINYIDSNDTTYNGYGTYFGNANHVVVKNLASIGVSSGFIGSYRRGTENKGGPYFAGKARNDDGSFLTGAEAEKYFTEQYIELNNLKVVDVTHTPGEWAHLGLLAHHNGKWVVKDCMIRHLPYEIDEALQLELGIIYNGGSYMNGESADLEITGNDVVTQSTLYGTTWGIGIGDNASTNSDHLRSIVISNNSVISDNALLAIHTYANISITDNRTVEARLFGITLDGGLDVDWYKPVPGFPAPKIIVKNNTINMVGGSNSIFNPFTAAFTGLGIDIFFSDSTPGWNVPLAVSSAEVTNNIFTGTANYAFYMGDNDLPTWFGLPPIINYGTGNVFNNNDLSGLTVTDGNYALLGCGTSNNTGTNIQISPGTSCEKAIYDGGINNYLSFLPNPCTNAQLALVKLIAKVNCFNLKQGISNSLDSKLSNALASLSAANAAQRTDAINKLNSFISQCQDQRGNKLTEAQADELIAAARAIIALLSQ